MPRTPTSGAPRWRGRFWRQGRFWWRGRYGGQGRYLYQSFCVALGLLLAGCADKDPLSDAPPRFEALQNDATRGPNAATRLDPPAQLAGHSAPAGDKVRGIVLSTHGSGRDWGSENIESTMADLRAVGATWVSIHPYARIVEDGTVGFRALDPSTPHLARPIAAAHAAGLEIAITPHLAYWRTAFSWAGDIEFATPEEWQRFFDTYTAWVVMLARACPQADGFVLGTEIDRTLGHEERWRELIRQVRAVTSAPLTYGANWTDYSRVPFWDALDAIGVQAYFPLADSIGAGVAEIEAGWAARMAELRTFAATKNRRIVFTELGYNRAFAAPVRPWEAAVDGVEAEDVQEMCLRIALAAVEREPCVAGAFLWKWFPNPHPVGRNFQLATPRLKRAIADVWLD